MFILLSCSFVLTSQIYVHTYFLCYCMRSDRFFIFVILFCCPVFWCMRCASLREKIFVNIFFIWKIFPFYLPFLQSFLKLVIIFWNWCFPVFLHWKKSHWWLSAEDHWYGSSFMCFIVFRCCWITDINCKLYTPPHTRTCAHTDTHFLYL